jgi:DNA-binding PadR family transcriptional regulator
MRKRKRVALTTPDLVLLSMLAERAMHGYQANLELERRCVRDWAGISRPQVYYSLEKLARAGFIRTAASSEPVAGPERSVFETTAKGRAAMADALEREDWATQRDHPVFPTWVALSWLARPGVFSKAAAAAAEIFGGRAGTRGRNAARDFAGSRAPAP